MCAHVCVCSGLPSVKKCVRFKEIINACVRFRMWEQKQVCRWAGGQNVSPKWNTELAKGVKGEKQRE